jgi:hypothetical protein
MSDIEKTISLKGIEKVYADLDRLRGIVKDLADKNAELVKGSKDNGSEFQGTIANWATGFLSVGAAVGVVSSAIRNQIDLQNKLGESYDNTQKKMIEQLAKANLLSNADEIDKFAAEKDRNGSFKFDRDKAVAAMVGASAGMPGASAADKQMLARSVMTGSELMSADDVKNNAELSARFMRMGVSSYADMPLVLQRVTGRESGALNDKKFTRNVENMIGAGVDRPTALSLNAAALDDDLGNKWAGSVVDAITTTDKPGMQDSRLKRQFLKADQSERAKMLMENPAIAKEMLGGTKAMEMQRTMGRFEDIRREVGGADGERDRRMAAAMSTELGRSALDEIKDEASNKQRDYETAAELDPMLDARARVAKYRDREIGKGGLLTGVGQYALKGVDAVTSRLPEFMVGSPREWAGQAVGPGDAEFKDYLRRNAEASEALVLEMRDDKTRTGKIPQAPSRSTHGE